MLRAKLWLLCGLQCTFQGFHVLESWSPERQCLEVAGLLRNERVALQLQALSWEGLGWTQVSTYGYNKSKAGVQLSS
jgi:hypothetical protein